MKKEISILGCGWLGEPLAYYLISAGYSVKASTRGTAKHKKLKTNQVTPFQLDLNVNAVIPKDFLNSEVLIICIPPGKQLNYRSQFDNLIGEISQSNIEQIIYISSTSVYAQQDQAIIEDHAVYASSERAQTLLDVENAFRELDSVDCQILRFAGLAGPGRNPGRFLAGKKDLPNGNAPVNFIHLNDCIGIIEQLIVQNPGKKTFHACAPIHPKKSEFYPYFAKKMGLQEPHFTIAETTTYKLINPEKLMKELKYTFKFPDPMKFIY